MLENNSVLEIPFLSREECDELIQFALRKRSELFSDSKLLELGDYKNISDAQVTTALYNSYSVLRAYPLIAQRLSDTLHKVLPKLTWPLLVQSWVNIYERGQNIDWHTHAGLYGSSFAANVFLGGPTQPGLMVGTYGAPIQTIENKVGAMLLMSSSMPHRTAPNIAEETRYSIGMTIHDFFAITPELLMNATLNSRQGSVLIM